MGEGGREGERARVVPGSHTSLPSASHSLPILAPRRASSLPISNEKRKQFKAPAHPPLPDKSVVLPCTFPATEGGVLRCCFWRDAPSTRNSNSSSTAPVLTQQQHSRDQSLLCLAANGRRVLCKSLDLEEAVGASEAVRRRQLTQSLRLLSPSLSLLPCAQSAIFRHPLCEGPSGCIAASGKRLQDVLPLAMKEWSKRPSSGAGSAGEIGGVS